ncbi:Wzy polymerase domain-containing protein [Aquincola sp. MAHUQ-54]|uniref:Wzy polymerase domain-containing protein n=1 Tax=Aquincola agrisoli TaxID=3119538 RepID=A0AAW9Q873_9BURK
MEKFFIHIGLMIIGLAYVMPGHYLPWVSFHQQAATTLGFFLVASPALLTAKKLFLHSPLVAFVFAMALTPLLQWSAGSITFSSDALICALYLSLFSLSILAGATLTDKHDTGWLGAFYLTLVCAATVSTLIATLQWLGFSFGWIIADVPPASRPFANLGQANQLATLLCMGLVAIAGLFELRRLGPLAAAFLAMCLAFGLVLTQSRTGLLNVLALLAWYALGRRKSKLRMTLPVVLAGGILFLTAALLWPFIDHVSSLPTEVINERLQVGPREAIWRSLAHAALQEPWLGYGWNQIGKALTAETTLLSDGMRYTQSAHNLLLDLAIWVGIPIGLAAGLILYGNVIQQALKCDNSNSWVLLSGTGVILIHSLLEYPLEYTYFLLPMGLMLGAIHRINGKYSNYKIPRFLVLCGTALAGTASIIVALQYFPLEESARQSQLAAMGIGDFEESKYLLERATALDAPREYIRFWSTPARANMTNEEISKMKDVAERNPTPPVLLRFAIAQALNANPHGATKTLSKICKIHIPLRCTEAKHAWEAAIQKYPALATISFPSM